MRPYSQVIDVVAFHRRWLVVTSQLDAHSGPVSADPWRDKKRRLWLMGLIAPTALFTVMPFVWALNQFG